MKYFATDNMIKLESKFGKIDLANEVCINYEGSESNGNLGETLGRRSASKDMEKWYTWQK